MNCNRVRQFSAVLLTASLSLPLTSFAQEKEPATAEVSVLVAENSELVDQVIMLAIEKELLASHAVDSNLIDVDVDNGIVTLSGKVSHLLAEDVAVSLAQRIRGVVSVVDLIEINTKIRPDEELKKDIVAAIAADPATHELHPNVEVKESVVTLTGEVPKYGEKVLLERVVKAVKGITEVNNELTNAQDSTVTDDELRKEISELYRFAVLLDDAAIQVDVKAGVVTINGEVSSAYQRVQAEQLAWHAGAKDVDSRGIRINGRHSDHMLRESRYQKATDEEIRDAVLRAWKHDPSLVGVDPQVEIVHGIATLTGDVSDLPAKLSAERTARYTIGVRLVKNHLRVRWPDETPSDQQILANVREALRRDPYVDPANMKLSCENAHIGLYGVADTEFEKEHAQWTASRQIGVVHVDNNLSVLKKWVKKSDAAIAADLKDRLELTFIGDENQVTAKVVNGVAILEGTVDSWLMWQTAIDQAMAAGAREPHVMIEVRYGEADGVPYYGPFDYVPR
jgi:osmotically-inducible protein OsmY